MSIFDFFKRKRTPLEFCELASKMILEAGNETFKITRPLLDEEEGERSSRLMNTHVECLAIYMHWAARTSATDASSNALFEATSNHILQIITAYVLKCWVPELQPGQKAAFHDVICNIVQNAELAYANEIAKRQFNGPAELFAQFSLLARGRIYKAIGDIDMLECLTSDTDEIIGETIIRSIIQGGFEKLIH